MSRSAHEERFLGIVLADPSLAAILDRAPALGVGDWWLTAGVLFQTVWNDLTGRPPGSGIRDADLFYFDVDTSWEAEDAVIRAGAELFADLPVPVEIRNEARVHLWYAEHFGVPAPPFRDCADAIDHFAAVCCCLGVTVDAAGRPRVYAPHGFDDLFALVVRPNPRLRQRPVGLLRQAPPPAYEQMLTDLADGLRDAVICYHVDRLTRRALPPDRGHAMGVYDQGARPNLR